MGKRLIVAEKPSVGREIAHVLNCRENHPDYIVGENDIVTWALGHLVTLAMPEDMEPKFKDWNMSDLPIIPDPFQLKIIPDDEKQFGIIKNLMLDSEVDSIVCATDAGREGELIFRYIYQMAGCTKPVERLWISSLTYGAIKDGFTNLKPASEYDNLYYSAKCRNEADWLVGINGTRAFSLVNGMKNLSVGRVMSPTLTILVKREMEIRNFIPKQYYRLTASFSGYTGCLLNSKNQDSSDRTHFSGEKIHELKELSKNHSSSGVVIKVETEQEAQPPQLLYDLTSLQRDANRIYNLSAKKTLNIAQTLYERKAITYPRTDSRYLSSDMYSTLKKRLEALADKEMKFAVKQALLSERNLFGRFINDKGVSDHHAIIPTGEIVDKNFWSKEEKQVFNLIAKRYIAMYYPDRIVVRKNILTSVDGKEFLSSCQTVTDMGWNKIDTTRSIRKTAFPDVKEGDTVNVLGMKTEMFTTTAPAPHTEASLLTAMEHAGTIVDETEVDDHETEFGIGTPATRADIIEKLVKKDMAFKKGKTIIPSEFGIGLVSILPPVLQSPEMTGKWEAKLSEISKGRETSDRFMNEIYALTQEIIDFSEENYNSDLKTSIYIGKCPLCGEYVKEYSNSYYCTNKTCDFRKLYKHVKGRPYLDS